MRITMYAYQPNQLAHPPAAYLPFVLAGWVDAVLTRRVDQKGKEPRIFDPPQSSLCEFDVGGSHGLKT